LSLFILHNAEVPESFDKSTSYGYQKGVEGLFGEVAGKNGIELQNSVYG
jgi:hypothetical protein